VIAPRSNRRFLAPEFSGLVASGNRGPCGACLAAIVAGDRFVQSREGGRWHRECFDEKACQPAVTLNPEP
jgi:hypothetical protein